MQIQNPTAVMIARTAVAQDDISGCAYAAKQSQPGGSCCCAQSADPLPAHARVLASPLLRSAVPAPSAADGLGSSGDGCCRCARRIASALWSRADGEHVHEPRRDGTTSTVLLIGELMKQAERHLGEGCHPRLIADVRPSAGSFDTASRNMLMYPGARSCLRAQLAGIHAGVPGVQPLHRGGAAQQCSACRSR